MMLDNITTTENNYQTHVDAVTEAVWLQWTLDWPEARDPNGDLCEQTTKNAAKAVNIAWHDGITTHDWVDAALQLLGA